jgi:tRNA pseudouridine38-40 synthase
VNSPNEPVPSPGDGLVRIRLDLGYDGGEFSGWARQPGRRTVEGVLGEALATASRLPRPPRLTVAGRTDAGVHARGQVAHVDLASDTDVAQLATRLRGLLPTDVRVARVTWAPPGFDARFAAIARRYAYRICDDPAGVDPLRRRDVLWHRRPLDVDAMNSAAQGLLGEHDFAAYCRPREGASTVRRLTRLTWTREVDDAGVVVADVAADAFCHNQVRAMVGALVAVGEGRQPVSWPATVLAAGVRDPAVTVFAAHGLTLVEVSYPPDEQLAERVRSTRQERSFGA